MSSIDKTKKILISGLVIITLIFFVIIYLFIPKIRININGDKTLNLEVGSIYEEMGAQAYLDDIFSDSDLDVEITGNVNTLKKGKYKITYEAKNGYQVKKTERIINVVDNSNPVITLEDEVKMCKNNQLVEIKAKAKDNYDGDITDKIKYKINFDKVYISVEDSSNNKTELIEDLKYIDFEKPEIKLNGPKNITLIVGQNYEEYGASAYDSCDGDITSKISINSELDTSKEGIYNIIYSVEDSSKNLVEESRLVTVINNSKSEPEKNLIPVKDGTIYLTFDDGPGQYTKQILDILDYYSIKATFFVTNQFPNFQNMIQEEYIKGHTVGVHTYSHKWSIYSSVDSYLEDFNKIENIVYNQTGVYPKIFRFPGGSSNTVSKNYCKGIMTELASIMTNKGYIYYDWTFDSGDTHAKNNTKEDILKNVHTYLKGDGEYIILMHDIKKNTLEALPEVIEYGLSRGYKFSSLTENVEAPHFRIAN